MNEASSKTNIINQCEITPQIWLLKTPPPIQTTNNLRRAVGSPNFAKGQFIILEGMITDEQCVPISDATVEIWQANSKGWLDYTHVKSNKSDPNFMGTGSMITNNMGHYNFLTVMPGSISQSRAPHINVRVRHRDFQAFESVIYFENSHLNKSDSILNREVKPCKRNSLIAKEQDYSMNDGIVYRLNITLDGSNRYKKY
jgi:protocatechuate 3,4-dioxygenase beta subunit